jgi:hypothetical protein
MWDFIRGEVFSGVISLVFAFIYLIIFLILFPRRFTKTNIYYLSIACVAGLLGSYGLLAALGLNVFNGIYNKAKDIFGVQYTATALTIWVVGWLFAAGYMSEFLWQEMATTFESALSFVLSALAVLPIWPLFFGWWVVNPTDIITIYL